MEQYYNETADYENDDIDIEGDIDISLEQPDMDIFIDKRSINRSIIQIYNDWLVDCNSEQLILQPSYQRELTWSFVTFNLFLDSVHHNFVMQPILLCKMNNFGSIRQKKVLDKYECLDGQHRLTTLKLYIDGKRLEDNFNDNYLFIKKVKELSPGKKIEERIFYKQTPELDNYIQSRSKSKTILYRYMDQAEIQTFNNIEFNIQIIDTDLTKCSNLKAEIFNRIQNGSKVSGVELLKNINHPLCKYLRENVLPQKELKTKCIKHIQFYQKILKDQVIVNLKKSSLNECYMYLLIKCYFIYLYEKLEIQKQFDLPLNIRRALINNTIPINTSCYELVEKSIHDIIEYINQTFYIHNKEEKVAEPIFYYLFYTYHFEPHFYNSLCNKLLCPQFMSEYNNIDNAKTYYISKSRLLINKIAETYQKVKNELIELPQFNTDTRQNLLSSISQLPPPPPTRFFLNTTTLTETHTQLLENSQLLDTFARENNEPFGSNPRLLNRSDLIFEEIQSNHSSTPISESYNHSNYDNDNENDSVSIISQTPSRRISPSRTPKHRPSFELENQIYNKTKIRDLKKDELIDLCIKLKLIESNLDRKKIKNDLLRNKLYELLQ